MENSLTIDRRTFLGTMIAFAASGTMLATNHLASSQPMSRYSEVIFKANSLVTLAAEYRANVGHNRDQMVREINVKTNELLGLMLGTFDGTFSSQDVKALFAKQTKIDGIDEIQLTKIADAVVPVAVMRELCYKHRLPFVPEGCSNWLAFMARYKDVILAV